MTDIPISGLKAIQERNCYYLPPSSYGKACGSVCGCLRDFARENYDLEISRSGNAFEASEIAGSSYGTAMMFCRVQTYDLAKAALLRGYPTAQLAYVSDATATSYWILPNREADRQDLKADQKLTTEVLITITVEQTICGDDRIASRRAGFNAVDRAKDPGVLLLLMLQAALAELRSVSRQR